MSGKECSLLRLLNVSKGKLTSGDGPLYKHKPPSVRLSIAGEILHGFQLSWVLGTYWTLWVILCLHLCESGRVKLSKSKRWSKSWIRIISICGKLNLKNCPSMLEKCEMCDCFISHEIFTNGMLSSSQRVESIKPEMS